MTSLIVIGAVIVLFIFVAYIGSSIEVKHIEDLEAITNELGFTFSETPDSVFIHKTKLFKLLYHGYAPTFGNLMQKQNTDHTLSLFDYKYKNSIFGKSPPLIFQSVALYEQKNALRIPPFVLTPKNFKIADLYTKKNINFPDSPAFSKQYLLKSDTEEAVRKFFTKDLQNFFTANPGYFIENTPKGLIIYRQREVISQKKAESMIAKWLEIYQLLSKA